MKKMYIKPEVNIVEVQANQAIAGCGIAISGYDNSWARGCNGQFGWPTKEQAWNAYNQHSNYTYSENKNDGLYVFPVYYGETQNNDNQIAYGTFHDENSNGIMDNGEYIAWQQGDYNALATMFKSGIANFIS